MLLVSEQPSILALLEFITLHVLRLMPFKDAPSAVLESASNNDFILSSSHLPTYLLITVKLVPPVLVWMLLTHAKCPVNISDNTQDHPSSAHSKYLLRILDSIL